MYIIVNQNLHIVSIEYIGLQWSLHFRIGGIKKNRELESREKVPFCLRFYEERKLISITLLTSLQIRS